MNADDLQDLYNSLRGSRSALAVLDARAMYLEHEMQQAFKKLTEAHTGYQESRVRLLKQDPEKQYAGEKDAERQIRRLKRKQEKARDILSVFTDLLGQLDRKARREQEIRKAEEEKAESSTPAIPEPAEQNEAAAPPPVQEQASTPKQELPAETVESEPPEVQDADSDDSVSMELNVARLSSVSERFLDEFQENWGDEQLDVIARSYAFLPVESENEIIGDALYFIRKGDESYLVFTPPLEQIGEEVTLTNVVSRKQMSPIPPEVFIKLGQQRKLVLLLDKENPLLRESPTESESEHSPTAQQAPSTPEADASEADAEQKSEDQTTELEPERQILDMGAFSQLMDAAQRSGLVPGADQIGFVRDREFRKGNYDLALQTIEGIFSKFTANAAARSQRLKREEADIAAGRMKISPKDLQAKRARDRAQDQAVARARSRFNRVLDGLRILMNN